MPIIEASDSCQSRVGKEFMQAAPVPVQWSFGEPGIARERLSPIGLPPPRPRRTAANQHADQRRRQATGAGGAQSGWQSSRLRDHEAAPDASLAITIAAAGADDMVLDEPLQRFLRQGQRPLDPGGV